MKRLALIAMGLMLSYGATYAQGTINFQNRLTAAGINAPILDTDATALDGTTDADARAQLWAGADAGSLAPVGTPVAFRTGAAAGFVVAQVVTLTGVNARSTVQAQIRAWRGAADWSAATVRGESNIVPVTVGGPVTGFPDDAPGNLGGLTGFQLAVVPEPSTLALAALGAGALLMARRRK